MMYSAYPKERNGATPFIVAYNLHFKPTKEIYYGCKNYE